jgi:two-component system, NtrC family, response regulator AtoC
MSSANRRTDTTPMQRLHEQLERLRQSPATPVLLVGPPGSGKQYCAEQLHRASYENERAPFVSVDCAALSREFFDTELFGHERGAFAEASATRRGLIELAQGGSLFLHEVTALTLAVQSRLLKFLDGMRLRRLGAQRDLELSLRVIASASREPLDLVKSGQFHEELYRRLAVFRLDVPALRERANEIAPLAQLFTEQLHESTKKDVRLSDEALAALDTYAFPGNVRELRSIIERAVVTAGAPLVTVEDLALDSSSFRASERPARFFEVETPADGVPPSLEVVEKAYVHRVLEHTGGRRMAAAQLLGISYPTFLKRLRELGVDEGHSSPRSSSASSETRRVAGSR